MGAFFEAVFYSFLVVLKIFWLPALIAIIFGLVCFLLGKASRARKKAKEEKKKK